MVKTILQTLKIKAGECLFPFIYKGKLIKECSDDKIKGKWCATEVNSKKIMTKLGFCPSSKKRISIKRDSKKKNLKNHQILNQKKNYYKKMMYLKII